MPTILRSEKIRVRELLEGSEVGDLSNCIYTFRWHGRPMYVGKTTIGVRNRLMHHIRHASDIGTMIKNAAPLYYGWWVEIWWIDRGLLEIERATIKQLDPALNKDRR